MLKKFTIFSIMLAISFASASSSWAGDRDRIEKLENEVRELRTVVNQLLGQQAGQPGVSAAPIRTEFTPPKLEIRGFGHVQYDATQTKKNDGTDGDTNHFTNGGMDLFITSQIAEKISFLNETIFEFGEDGANILDVERVLIKYEPDDRLNIAIGRGHTALGYWNQRFHHGTWLHTTATRPLLYNWEDDGGILPVHFVGLEFSGNFALPAGSLSYQSNVANGRGKITDEVKLIEDNNDSKMLSFMATYEPFAIEGLGVGASVLFDQIPEDPDTASRVAEIDEQIYGLHAFYTLDPWEVILEGLLIQHENHDNGLKDDTVGAYGQLAYKVGKYKPYFRMDWLNIADRDVFFAGAVPDQTHYTLGLRYELTTWNAIKLEARHIDTDEDRRNEATIQSSFAF